MMARLDYSAVEYVLFDHPVETDPEHQKLKSMPYLLPLIH